MKNLTTFASVFALIALASGTDADAAAMEYQIDGVHSSVVFKVKNRDISHVVGFFKKISGTISVDRPINPEQVMINAELAVKSIDTNDKKRDRHLTSPDFLDRAKYAKISFKTKQSKMLESNRFELTGELDLLGVKKEITVLFELTGLKKTEQFTHRIGGQANFTIKRSDFGMNHMIPEIADEVTIMVNVEGERTVVPSG